MMLSLVPLEGDGGATNGFIEYTYLVCVSVCVHRPYFLT